MVAIVPNRTEVEGIIVSVKKESTRKDFLSMQFQLISVTRQKDDLIFSDIEPDNIVSILIAQEVLKINKLKTGLIISCMIRKAAREEYFIIPDSIHIVSEKKG